MYERHPLAQFSSYNIGGPARYFIDARTPDEIMQGIALAREQKLPFLFFGGGTNLLISDEGFPGVVIRPNITHCEHDGVRMRVGAGVLMRDAIEYAAVHGLRGLEWAGGLPGTVGGAIRGNAGCFGGETKDSIESVEALNVETGARHEFSNAMCEFGYRTSVFKNHPGEYAILNATFALTPGDPVAIRSVMERNMQYRIERHPMEYPNIGSIFKNVDAQHVPADIRATIAHVVKTDPFPVVPAAYLIAESGLKGMSRGGAMISPKHPNFIVNVLDASASDVAELIELAKREVADRFGVTLVEEIQRVA